MEKELMTIFISNPKNEKETNRPTDSIEYNNDYLANLFISEEGSK